MEVTTLNIIIPYWLIIFLKILGVVAGLLILYVILFFAWIGISFLIEWNKFSRR